MLKQQKPEGKDDSFDLQELVVPRISRLLQCKLNLLRALVRNLEGSLRLVHNLDLLQSVRPMDKD